MLSLLFQNHRNILELPNHMKFLIIKYYLVYLCNLGPLLITESKIKIEI